jgi:hypothetical protein
VRDSKEEEEEERKNPQNKYYRHSSQRNVMKCTRNTGNYLGR